MCGISGLYLAGRAERPPFDAEAVVRAMNRSMAHRGPDADGIWADSAGRCILGHRRLSIIDTSDAGRQPMQGLNSPWIISLNGELYNFQEVRPELESHGVKFHGRTDTEVLLQAISLWSTDALPRLDGMFAFAAFKSHVNFMPTPSVVGAFREELADYTTGKGSIQFPHDEPLPKTLIAKMAKHRIKELREKDAKWM